MSGTEPGWLARARAEVGREWPAVQACDPVNAPMIRHWQEAFGFALDWQPAEAPATMLQPWLFPGPSRARPPGSPTQDATALMALFAEGGFSAAVTVSTELECLRPLVPGDRLDYLSALESIGDEKRTGLGLGRFLGFCFTVRDAAGQVVGRLRFTNLVYRPESA